MLPLPRHVPLRVDSMMYYYSICITSSSCYLVSSIICLNTHSIHLCSLYLLENNHYNGYEWFCKNISFHFCRVIGHGTFSHSSSHAVLPMLSLILFSGIIGMPKNVLYFFSRCKDSSHIFTLAGQAEFH